MQTAVEPATDDAVMRARARRVTLAVIASAYMLIAAALSLTKIPICDEGWYADPALHLIRHGNMGSPVLESAGTFLTSRRPTFCARCRISRCGCRQCAPVLESF